MHVGLLKALENGCCSCWTTWSWFWVLQSVGVACQTSTTLVAKFVSSLLPRSPSLSADGSRLKVTPPTSHLVQNVTNRARLPMLTNDGQLQRGQPLTRSCLPSSQPNPHELPVKKSKSRKDESRFACDAKKEDVHELEHTSPRRAWLANIPSSASRPSSSRGGSPLSRSSATRSRSTSFWPLRT